MASKRNLNLQIFLILYYNKETKKHGFTIAQGRSWDALYARMRQELGTEVVMTSIKKCGEVQRKKEKLLFKYEEPSKIIY